MATKRCMKCGDKKPFSEFWKEAGRPDGLQRRCKDCFRVAYRLNRYPKLRNNPNYKAARRRNQKLYTQRHPQVVAAHRQARANQGAIKKSACEQCGNGDQLHMHHFDYGRPLAVVTLCVPCHEATHHGVLP